MSHPVFHKDQSWVRFVPTIHHKINDHIQSTIKLFADDSILYGEIQNPQDLVIIQEDLNTLADWADRWLMSRNVPY